MGKADADDLSFTDIPDPASRVALREPPAPPALAEPALTRSARQRRVALAAFASLLWLVAGVAQLKVRPDITELGVLARLLSWSAAGALAWGLLFRRGARGLPAGARLVRLGLVAVPLVYLATILLVPGSASPPERHGPAYLCSTFALALAAGPLALAVLLFRGTFLSSPGARGAGVGAVCGLIGAVAIYVHCSMDTTLHVLVSHGVPIVLCTLLGAGLGVLHGRV